jgi:hypothetical protein
MAKAGRGVIKRLTAPEIREIIKEELSVAIRPLDIKIAELDKRLTSQIWEVDKRVTAQIQELERCLIGQIQESEKRLTNEITSLKSELQYSTKLAVLEAKVSELEKKLAAR